MRGGGDYGSAGRNEGSPVKPCILVVEDEPSLALTLGDRLRAEGYAVDVRGDGEAALAAALESRFDLVILDVMLPGIDGFAVVRELRRRSEQVPILMLTARTEVVDRVVGLRLGADDYLGKPFEMAELLARVEALLRRARSAGSIAPGIYRFGGLSVDFRAAEVSRDGHRLGLSAMEYKLLACLIEHRGAVLSREALLDEVWGQEATPFSRTVDVHVASLRQKVEPNPSHPRFIVTVHRFGYRFDG
jgi:two-component system, OmpR family, alkaline phosphatase synthesis response regulator PhoP